MRRLFGKSNQPDKHKDEDEPKELPDTQEEDKTNIASESKPSKKGPHGESRDQEKGKERLSPKRLGEGDAERGRRRVRHTVDTENPVKSSNKKQRGTHHDHDNDNYASDSDNSVDEKEKTKALRKDKRLVEIRPSTSAGVKEIVSESGETKDQNDDDTPPASSKRKTKTKEKLSLKPPLRTKSRTELLELGYGNEESIQFINKKDLGYVPKVEPGKNGHFLASVYNYDKPMTNFRVRAKLLKYPTFSDQDVWPGDFAVIDDRIFEWQEKVYSKREAKRFRKVENCKTDQDKSFRQDMLENPESVGNFLYSYVTDNSYVAKKKLRTLVRRCPVPHSRAKEKSALQFQTMDGESINDDIDNVDEYEDLNSDDSIDFDKPVSSSTPKTKRKQAKEAQEIAKVEKRERAKEEKVSKAQEKRNRKQQQMSERKEKEEETKRKDEEIKAVEQMKKLKSIEEKETEHRHEYMKKYNYSRRPSVPLGVRMRSVRLSPSPKKDSKLKSRKKSEDGLNMDPSVPKSQQQIIKETRRNGQTYGGGISGSMPSERQFHERPGRYTSMVRTNGSKTHRKFWERRAISKTETMFIMASIPHLPRKNRDIVVCMVQNLPQHGVIILKPTLGYRNIEATRNHIFRVSCELHPSLSSSQGETTGARRGLKSSKTVLSPAVGNTQEPEDFGPFFETVPNSELKLTVMGEITTADGFDSSPICIYYVVDIPKGWRNDSIINNTEGITHACYTDGESVAHFSHEFAFQLVFSMDSVDESDSFPTPVIALLVVSMNHTSPRIIYEGYGYVSIPMTPGSHLVKIRTWRPKSRTTFEKMREAFLDITPSLQDMKFSHAPYLHHQDHRKANLVGLHTNPSGTVKLRLHVIHQTATAVLKDHEKKLDLLEKMSSATILRSVQAVIEAFQRARQKAMNLKNKGD